MKKTVPLRISGHTLFVEMEEMEIEIPGSSNAHGIQDLPEGSEAVSAVDRALDAFDALEAGLSGIVAKLRAAVSESKPTTWKLEVNIGFKGKTTPIPVVLSGEAEAALKLQLEWTQ